MTDYKDEIIDLIWTEHDGEKFLLIKQLDKTIFVPFFKLKKMIKGIEYLIESMECDNE